MAKSQVWIGTSGWFYRHWYGKIYPSKLSTREWLSYYATHFDTVEVNSTFYRLPSRNVVLDWYRNTPAEFVFALKISRFVSHIKRLKSVHREWKQFLMLREWLKEKVGPLLLQLPPSFEFSGENFERLKNFLRRCRKSNLRVAVEFRHSSWDKEKVFQLLTNYNTALCIAHGPKGKIPIFETLTADFVYLRFHGSPRLYASSYSLKQLQQWAAKIRQWRDQGREIFVYFNNDFEGYAFQNAKTLKELVVR